MTDMGEMVDVTILGGGPVGLFAAYYAGMRGMTVKIIEAMDALGGQLTALYPEKFIFDAPGFECVTARELVARLSEQAMRYRPTVCLNEVTTGLERVGSGYRLATEKRVHETRTVIIAAGAGAFRPKKWEVRGMDELVERSVFYSSPNTETFRAKRVLVVGGSFAAVEDARRQREAGGEVTLVHRHDEFRTDAAALQALAAPNVTVLPFFQAERLLVEKGALQGILLRHVETGEERQIDADAIVVREGAESSLGFLSGWGLDIQNRGIAVNAAMETNLPGVFAAGDVAMYAGKLKLLATGFGEAAVAANQAFVRISPGAKVFPGHSSELVAQPGAKWSEQ